MSHTMSGFIRYILHVFLILSVSVSAAGEYTVRNLSVADGLSSDYVLSILPKLSRKNTVVPLPNISQKIQINKTD